MRVEEVEGKDKACGQQGFVRVHDHGDVNHPARQESGEEQGEPHDQPGSPDHGDAPEYGEIVELFPVCPAVELRAGPLAEEPFLVCDELAPVIQIRDHGIRAEHDGQELLDGEPSGYRIEQVAAAPPAGPDAVGQMQGEIEEGDDGRKMVEGARHRGATQNVKDHLGPLRIMEFERHSRDNQQEEAGDHHDVEHTLEWGES